MELFFRNIDNEFIKSISFEKFELCQNFIPELNVIKKPALAYLITSNEKINFFELEKLKLTLEELNIKLICIYSDSRETIIS